MTQKPISDAAKALAMDSAHIPAIESVLRPFFKTAIDEATIRSNDTENLNAALCDILLGDGNTEQSVNLAIDIGMVSGVLQGIELNSILLPNQQEAIANARKAINRAEVSITSIQAQLEQWKACAEKYALMLNRICPDIHTFNSGVSPREIRGLVDTFNQLKGQ